MCRFCVDGVGELADVSCGDAWYLLPDGEPDCSEHEGRNFIFSRSDKGDSLVKEAFKAGYIFIDDNASLEKLRQAQKYKGPCVIHVMTIKGYGYEQAEKKPEKFHGTPPFYIETGDRQKMPEDPSAGHRPLYERGRHSQIQNRCQDRT